MYYSSDLNNILKMLLIDLNKIYISFNLTNNGDYYMLEQVIMSCNIENLNEIKIFVAYKDKDIVTSDKKDNLIIGIEDFISRINENNSYKISYKAFFPPETDYFIIEFMKITTLPEILEANYDQVPFNQAKRELADEVRGKLQILINSLK